MQGADTMRKSVLAMLVGATVLSGCATVRDSALNPLNWFGSRSDPTVAVPRDQLPPLVPEGAGVQIIDQREVIAQVTEARLERTADGALLRATGIAPAQGFFNAQLVRVASDSASVLRFQFRAQRPAGEAIIGSAASREITVATPLSEQTLVGIRSVIVEGASGAVTARR